MSAQDKDLALAIRTCKADGTSYGGFQWPIEIGAEVSFPDWNPNPVCGGGGHALLDGWGDWGLLNSDMDARWQIIEIKRSECIDIRNKVKFPRCKLVYSGDMATAMTKISKWQIGLLINVTQNNADFKDCKPDSNNAQIGSSGDSAQIGSSGDSAKIGSSGDFAQIGSSGYSAKIGSSGYSAKIGSSGYYAQIGSSGDSAQIEAKGKDAVVAAAGSVASFMLGENGCAAIPYRDGTRTRFFLAYVGENCEAGVRYAVSGKGELIPA